MTSNLVTSKSRELTTLELLCSNLGLCLLACDTALYLITVFKMMASTCCLELRFLVFCFISDLDNSQPHNTYCLFYIGSLLIKKLHKNSHKHIYHMTSLFTRMSSLNRSKNTTLVSTCFHVVSSHTQIIYEAESSDRRFDLLQSGAILERCTCTVKCKEGLCTCTCRVL